MPNGPGEPLYLEAPKKLPRPEPPPLPRRPMVRWYSPRLLLATGIQVLVSAALGNRIDYRLMEADGGEQPSFKYDRDTDGQWVNELWLDYLADTGDGWNPTYAVASLVARPELEVGGTRLERGRILILGGDEVYPYPSARSYRERLLGPFRTALPSVEPPDPHPHLFAIPGNHDWYDNLVSFSRRFSQERWFGGWRTRQQRSYFALKLPHRWWLWAVDVQLESDIDPGQLDYFRRLARRELAPGDRIILASAEPEWLYHAAKMAPAAKPTSNLAYLQEEIIKKCDADVYLWLAGDLHHYARHEKYGDPNRQRITSGGGGAFLHPTHGPLFGAARSETRHAVTVDGDLYERKATFPSGATSFRLSLLNLLFLFRNPTFGLLPALGYLAVAWGRLIGPGGGQPSIWTELATHPLRVVLMLVLLAAFVFFADSTRPLFRWIGGLAHGLAHIALALAIAAWAASAFGGAPEQAALRLGASFLGGWVLGSVLWGLYLLVALNLFGAHQNEAFSALRIQDYKHFLRLHVTPAGDLEIYPIGIPKVPRRAGARVQYLLIEDPLTIRPRPPV